MTENENDIVLTLSTLYEILLQIGQSFDIYENAKSFLRTLMLQQNLSFAGYYTYNNQLILEKVLSIPKTQFIRTDITPKTLEIFSQNDLVILNRNDKAFHFFDQLNNFDQRELGVFRGGEKSIILLSLNIQELSFSELNKYSLVFNKFCLFMESLKSHNQINKEIRIKNEQAETIRKNVLQLEKQNIELRKYINSNNELEKFAYRTSHDLKAPLRSLIAFSKLLCSNSDSNLTEKQLNFLDIIYNSSLQMDQLIDGILAYSKINETKVKKDKVDIAKLLDQVELMLFDNIKKIDARLIKENLPPFVEGDEIKLKQLFLNLINNALKFHRNGVKPVIIIACIPGDADYQFSIKDNGIGMKKEDTSKIFEVFERLNASTSYQGSGIGLSTCKQIVIQHGGKIWVDSNENQGSTFYFTLESSKTLILKQP